MLISGVPGAGKTTVSQALARTFARGVHLEGDLIGHHFIVSGLVPPQGPPQDEAERQLLLRRRNICQLADSFAAEDFTVVVDDVVLWPGLLELYLQLLTSRPVAFVLLAPDREVLRLRDARRDKHVFDIWGHLADDVDRWSDAPGLRLDTTRLTVAETVDAVRRNLFSAVVT